MSRPITLMASSLSLTVSSHKFCISLFLLSLSLSSLSPPPPVVDQLDQALMARQHGVDIATRVSG